MYPAPQASPFLTNAFIAFGLTIAAGFVWLRWKAGDGRRESREQRVRSTIVVAALAIAWLIATWMVSATGVLGRFDRFPPPFALLFLSVAAVSVALGLGPIGTALVQGLPLWGLVLAQAFRLPLELVMHQGVIESVMPNQMSYSGANFDIVTGSTAVIVAALLATRRAGRGLALAWNVMGALLLANVLIIALLSTPTFALFGSSPDRLNTWVAHPPFIWLPTIMVVAAFAGHIIVARKIASTWEE